ncbi:MAG: hypothetical protein JWQ35_2786 [Bacteriovoracaceae bacterium]|nr:hypothetical protein [Bacteriovoracaceae bacterium]
MLRVLAIFLFLSVPVYASLLDGEPSIDDDFEKIEQLLDLGYPTLDPSDKFLHKLLEEKRFDFFYTKSPVFDRLVQDVSERFRRIRLKILKQENNKLDTARFNNFLIVATERMIYCLDRPETWPIGRRPLLFAEDALELAIRPNASFVSALVSHAWVSAFRKKPDPGLAEYFRLADHAVFQFYVQMRMDDDAPLANQIAFLKKINGADPLWRKWAISIYNGAGPYEEGMEMLMSEKIPDDVIKVLTRNWKPISVIQSKEKARAKIWAGNDDFDEKLEKMRRFMITFRERALLQLAMHFGKGVIYSKAYANPLRTWAAGVSRRCSLFLKGLVPSSSRHP